MSTCAIAVSGEISAFAAVPAQCELPGGVFLAASKSTLNDRGVLFDLEKWGG
jgi:hypothetical protein